MNQADYHREYHIKNRDAILTRKRAYYARRREDLKAKSRERYYRIRDKDNERRRLRYANNAEAERAVARARSPSQSERRRARQEIMMGHPRPEACEICGDLGPVVFDHCHASGLPRGWLCSNCNTAIGLLKDSTQRLEMAAAYLKRHEARRNGAAD